MIFYFTGTGNSLFAARTLAHDDHAGFLNEVLAATGADVILHPGAVEGLKRGQNSFEGGCSVTSWRSSATASTAIPPSGRSIWAD